MVLNTATTAMPRTAVAANSKKRQSIDNSQIRFPKLDECAHFHYDSAEFDEFHLSLINQDATRLPSSPGLVDVQNLNIFVRVQCSGRSWTVRRDLRDFIFLDTQLHKCVFDREHSRLKPLKMTGASSSLERILDHIGEYFQCLSSVVRCGNLTCGPILHWFEMDNHGNRLINEESDINTPAIGAAFVIKKHCKKDVETEISLEIGELISVIEMPPLSESFYWKGKKGFEVGFFPAECVQLIDDKISRKSEELSLRPLKKCVSPTLGYRPLMATGSADSPTNAWSSDSEESTNQDTAMSKHSKISALFRNFVAGIRTRRRDQLKRSGILKERVFGCDICEHLENSGHDVPLVLTACCAYIEANGLQTNGIYRISGVVSTINRLRNIFDEDRIPVELTDSFEDYDSDSDTEPMDIHAVGSLLKLYFRELPNPLLTYSLFDAFISTMRDETLTEQERVQCIKKLVRRLPPPHWRTLRFLIRHLSLVSQFHSHTGMTSKNIAIVWAPNLLRTKSLDLGREALQIVTTQAVLTEFLITNCDKIFDQEDPQPSKPLYCSFVHTHTSGDKSALLSSKCLKYIDVGPEIVPGKFHTVITCRRQISNPKRSKFNLQNLKMHFSLSRHRPSVRTFQSDSSGSTYSFSSNNNHRKTDRHSSGPGSLSQSHSVKYTNSFHSKICCCPTSNSNKQVKRSQSFDSYFIKIKAGKFQDNRRRQNPMTGDEGDPLEEDIVKLDLPAKSEKRTLQEEIYPIIDKIMNRTIFEDEETRASEKHKLTDDCGDGIFNSLISNPVDMAFVDDQDDIDDDDRKLTITASPLLCESLLLGTKPPNDNEGQSCNQIDVSRPEEENMSILAMAVEDGETRKTRSGIPDCIAVEPSSKAVNTLCQDRDNFEKTEDEKRKKIQLRTRQMVVPKNGKTGSEEKPRFYASVQKLETSSWPVNGSRPDRATLGRSVPAGMEFHFTFNGNGDITVAETMVDRPHSMQYNGNGSKPDTAGGSIKFSITPLRTVNKRQRIIYDNTDLSPFFSDHK